MNLRYTVSGYIYISPLDDCQAVVDAMLATDYSGDFCIAEGFDPEFTAKLMKAGFLVMSMNIAYEGFDPYYIMMPKLHLVRSALFFENLHIKKSIRRLLKYYELRADVEFDQILDICVEKHGSDWLTPPLVECVKQIRRNAKTEQAILSNFQSLVPSPIVYPASFSLYRDGKLVAGEFGIIYNKVYTSYSGFYYENNAGTVQLILTVKYLKEHGFSFFDMGMPLDYKADLGAVNISPYEFVQLFREP